MVTQYNIQPPHRVLVYPLHGVEPAPELGLDAHDEGQEGAGHHHVGHGQPGGRGRDGAPQPHGEHARDDDGQHADQVHPQHEPDVGEAEQDARRHAVVQVGVEATLEHSLPLVGPGSRIKVFLGGV